MASQDGDTLLPLIPHMRGRSRTRRDVVCWHCGKRGHMKRRCFRRWRQQKKRRKDAMCLANASRAGRVTMVTHDGDVRDASQCGPTYVVTESQCTLSQDLLLSMDATFHVIPHREWFSTYATRRHDCVHGDDGSCDIAGVGDVCLVFASGASIMLRDVRHVPGMASSLISIGQLRDSGCHVTFRDESWKMRKGSLAIARGARIGTDYPLHVRHVRDGIVFVTSQPCADAETRRVSFQDTLHDCSAESVVQVLSYETHVERDISMDAQLEQSSVEMTSMAHMQVVEPEIDASFFDMLMAEDDLDAMGDTCTLGMHRVCDGHDSFRMWENMCQVFERFTMERGKVSSTPLSTSPYVKHEHDLGPGFDVAKMAKDASTYARLMYGVYISRPDIAFAVVAFAIGAISSYMADFGKQHADALYALIDSMQHIHWSQM